jgi:hypothetical protein
MKAQKAGKCLAGAMVHLSYVQAVSELSKNKHNIRRYYFSARMVENEVRLTVPPESRVLAPRGTTTTV